MARINVEDSFYRDPRFRALTRKVGNEDEALGQCIRMWLLAQKYWGKENRSNIPFEIFTLEGLDHMIDALLAERKDDGIYVKGSKDQFDWYHQKVEAGKRSVESRKKKKSSQTHDKRPLNVCSPPLQPPSPAPTLSLNKIITHTEGDNKKPSMENKSGNSPSESLKLRSIRAATKTIAAMHRTGIESEAQKIVSDEIWEILEQKYPNDTWKNWRLDYRGAIKRKVEALFQKDLKEHFEAFLK